MKYTTLLKISALTASLLFFQACGDDDKSNSNVEAEITPTTIKGFTTLTNGTRNNKATVCLDENGNNKCDADEPQSGINDDTGAFEFVAPNGATDGDTLLAVGGLNKIIDEKSSNTFSYKKAFKSDEDTQYINMVTTLLVLDNPANKATLEEITNKYDINSNPLDDKEYFNRVVFLENFVKNKASQSKSKQAFRVSNKIGDANSTDTNSTDSNATETGYWDSFTDYYDGLYSDVTTYLDELVDFNFFDGNTSFANIFDFNFFDNNDTNGSFFDTNLTDTNLTDINLSDINLTLPSYDDIENSIQEYQDALDSYYDAVTAFYDKFLAYFGINDIDELAESNLTALPTGTKLSRDELNGAWLIKDNTTATNNKRCYYIQKSNAITLYELKDGNESVRNLIISIHGKDDNATFINTNHIVSMEIKQGFISLDTVNFTSFNPANHSFKATYEEDGVKLTGQKKKTYKECKDALAL